MFDRKIKAKYVRQLENNIVDLLEPELPELRKAIEISKLNGISFTSKPKGISISRGYSLKVFEELNRNHRTYFNLTGISIWNRKAENYQPIKLNYYFDTLTTIEVEKPEYFHKTFDLNKIYRDEIFLEHLSLENPDRKIAEKALKLLSNKQLELLELDSTFEIEYDEKVFYTILDMEDGNYFAVDKKGGIFRLNHDHTERVKLISNNPIDFFKFYSGDKSELENLLHE